MAITVLPSASSSRFPSSGAVISSGAWAAICGMAPAAEATVTRPAPARSAAMPAMAAAPVLPREPPTTSTCPNVPLCPQGGRGASNSRNMAGSTSDSRRVFVKRRRAADGRPPPARPRGRNWAAAPAPSLGAVKVTVQSARANSPTGSPESLGMPEGISTATTLASGNPLIDFADAFQHAAGGRTGDAGAEQRIDHQGGAARGRPEFRARPGSRKLRACGNWRRRRPSAPPDRPAAPRAATRGWKRVKSWRATTMPSPPLLPLPHSTTMRCAASGANRSASDFHHAMAGILHQHDAGDAEFDGAPVHFAHFGRGQDFHKRRATTMVISSCNSRGAGPLVHRLHGAGDDLGGVGVGVLDEQLLQALLAEHLAVGVLRLHDAVGVGHQHVAVLAAATVFSS